MTAIREITGSVTDPGTASKAADDAIAAAQAQVQKLKLAANIPQSNLVQTVNVLSEQLGMLADKTAKAEAAQAAAEADATKAHADADAQIKDAQAKVADAADQVAKIQAEEAAKEKESTANVAGIQNADQKQLQVYSQAIQSMQQVTSSLNQKISTYEKLITHWKRTSPVIASIPRSRSFGKPTARLSASPTPTPSSSTSAISRVSLRV